jgi:hypothetical protein
LELRSGLAERVAEVNCTLDLDSYGEMDAVFCDWLLD